MSKLRQTSLCEKLKHISGNHEMNSDEEIKKDEEMDSDKLEENENNSNLTYDEMMTAVDPMIGMEGDNTVSIYVKKRLNEL